MCTHGRSHTVRAHRAFPAIKPPTFGLSRRPRCSNSKLSIFHLKKEIKLTPFNRLIRAFFCPLLDNPLSSNAALRSATRSEWSGLPSSVTSSRSAILHPLRPFSSSSHRNAFPPPDVGELLFPVKAESGIRRPPCDGVNGISDHLDNKYNRARFSE